MGDHGDRARVGCGDLRPPDVARPDTHRFLAEVVNRVVLIERERVRGRLRGGVRGDERRRNAEPPSEPEPATLAPEGTGNSLGRVRGQLPVKGENTWPLGMQVPASLALTSGCTDPSWPDWLHSWPDWPKRRSCCWNNPRLPQGSQAEGRLPGARVSTSSPLRGRSGMGPRPPSSPNVTYTVS